jgi:broad specificity phosphatase PhoE
MPNEITLDPARTLLGYLVRHGELKNMRVWDSWGDFNLSEKGRESAEKAAQYLSFEKIGRIVSSDLPRTVETAQCIMETCNVACPWIMYDPNIRPWMVADFTGKEKTPERIAEFQKYMDDPSLVIPDGESRNQLNLRIQVIPQYLASPYCALPTVMVLHNSVIKSLMGLDDIRDAVNPGGIIAVYLTEKGECEFEVVLGFVSPEIGVS